MPKGYLAVVLHAHLPYVRHPEHERFLEELWFYEAMAETYIPLLRMLEGLEDDNVGYKLLLGLSPTLVSMMEDSLLQERFTNLMRKTIRLADQEEERRRHDPERRALARFHGDHYRDVLHRFENKCHRRVARAFAEIAAYGNMELMTCGATHGFLPVLQQNPGSVKAQFSVASRYHREIFGVASTGIWLPECAYCPGIEPMMAENDFAYSFVDSHGLENASARPVRGVYAPVTSPEGVSFFGRDKETGLQVWSADQGYPGHPDYREFYHDIGFELPEKDLSDFLIAGHIRVNTGIKYYRITSRRSGDKALYSPRSAREQAARHAENFVRARGAQVERLASGMDRSPIIVAPYDAELFGHWWFEGLWFLDYVFRKMHFDQDAVKAITPSMYLSQYPDNQAALPGGSSWGGDGTYEFWVNDKTADLISQLHQAADRMSAVATAYRRILEHEAPTQFPSPLSGKAAVLRQMQRELMLAQASDWPFIIRTGTSPEYAIKRIKDHMARFWILDAMLDGEIDHRRLDAICLADAIFPEIDPGIFDNG